MSRVDAAKEREAHAARLALDRYLQERKAVVCSRRFAEQFAKAPASYRYTTERCNRKAATTGAASSRTGAASASASASSPRSASASASAAPLSKLYDEDVASIEQIIHEHYVPARAFLKKEKAINHDVVTEFVSRMLLPHYVAKFRKPMRRLAHIQDELQVKNVPKLRVLSTVLFALKALRAPMSVTTLQDDPLFPHTSAA